MPAARPGSPDESRVYYLIGYTPPAGKGPRDWRRLKVEVKRPGLRVRGVAQARVVARDEFLGRLGAVTVRFVVPSVTGLRVSTPILSPRLLPPKEGRSRQPAILARREFEPSGSLYCQFHVFGATVRSRGPQVEASFELRRRSGEVVRRGSPSLIEPSQDGRLVRLLGLPSMVSRKATTS